MKAVSEIWANRDVASVSSDIKIPPAKISAWAHKYGHLIDDKGLLEEILGRPENVPMQKVCAMLDAAKRKAQETSDPECENFNDVVFVLIFYELLL